MQLQESNLCDHLIPTAHVPYIQYWCLQDYSSCSTAKCSDLDSFYWEPLNALSKGRSLQVPIKDTLPNHHTWLFSVRLTPKILLLHVMVMFVMVLVPFIDISRKYYFNEVIIYILENNFKKKKQEGDMQGEEEQFQGTQRSKENQFPRFGHSLWNNKKINETYTSKDNNTLANVTNKVHYSVDGYNYFIRSSHIVIFCKADSYCTVYITVDAFWGNEIKLLLFKFQFSKYMLYTVIWNTHKFKSELKLKHCYELAFIRKEAEQRRRKLNNKSVWRFFYILHSKQTWMWELLICLLLQ